MTEETPAIERWAVKDRDSGLWITAPSGWCRDYKRGGTKRGGTDPRKAGPEMGREQYWFKSRKYAEQQAAKLINPEIVYWSI